MRLGVEAALVSGDVVAGDVEVDDGRIVAVGLSGSRGVGLAVPGFVDLQVNGFAGTDFATSDVAGYAAAATAMAATGVTSFQPTLISLPVEAYPSMLEVVAEASRYPLACRLLGAHLEGPFLARAWCGAHNPANIIEPDHDVASTLLAAGPVSYLTLAPERSGALELIDQMIEAGVTVSIGHSDATSAVASAAFARGARSVTHLFNAQTGLDHREPGIPGAALAHHSAAVTLIVDGIHLAPEVVNLVFAAAPGRVALITDAIEAAGLGSGTYRVGDREVTVAEGVAKLSDGTLAGSVVTMDQSVRNLVELGIPLVTAVEAATKVPARIIDRADLGSLRPGAVADVVVLEDSMAVLRTVVGGGETYRA